MAGITAKRLSNPAQGCRASAATLGSSCLLSAGFIFCKLSPPELAKLANFNPPVSSCRSVFTVKISLDQGRLVNAIDRIAAVRVSCGRAPLQQSVKVELSHVGRIVVRHVRLVVS